MSDSKGLTVSIYTNPTYKGCSAGGVSEKVTQLTIVGVIDRTVDLGNKTVTPMPKESQILAPAEDRPAAILVKRRLFGDKPTLHVEPLDKPEGHVMAGGAFVSTSDSRWSKMIGFYGAVPLHDRVEGWKS